MDKLYCKKWWYARKKPIDIMDEKVAYNNHINGNDYSVVISENEVVLYVLDISKNDIFVSYMNECGEKYLTYAFHREDKEKLFLNAAYYHTYEDDKEVETIVFGFDTNGEMSVLKRNLGSDVVEEKEAIVDVSVNWEQYPKFGEYDKLIVLERNGYKNEV